MSGAAEVSEREESEMGDVVKCIQVGGEYHVAECADGALPRTIWNLTEQCDNCGSSGEYVYDDRFTKTGGVVTSHPGFSCLECGRWYEIVERDASKVVF